MTTPFLATGDIHLTDDPRDEYRWRIFKFLRRMAEKHGVNHFVILGDLTDKKDKHSSRLVNRIVDELHALPGRVVVMKGNHDYDADPDTPFFRFLGHGGGAITAGLPVSKVSFFTTPQAFNIGTTPCLIIPHVRKTDGYEWPKVPAGTRFVFTHQTFHGAVSENGMVMPGLPPDLLTLPDGCEIVSGDIHVPQVLGGITYAGAPHPIRFGDSFQPRVLWFDGGTLQSIDRRTIRKDVLTIRTPDDLATAAANITEGDQVKVVLRLRRRDFGEWPTMREQVLRWAHKSGVTLVGCRVEERKPKVNPDTATSTTNARTSQTPEELFRLFCAEKNIDPAYVKAGMRWLHAEAR